MTSKTITLGKYQHYKSNHLYEVIGLALHSETHEEMVIYQALYFSEQFGMNRIWTRPKSMFFENVEYQGQTVARFKLIEAAMNADLHFRP